MTRRRIAPLALVALVSAAPSACDDGPRHRDASATQNNEPPLRAPVAIGRGDGEVPQVHLPPRLVPPTAASTPIPLSLAAALTRTADGGALLLWSSAASSVRAVSQLALRSISPDGAPGPIWELRRTPGVVHAVDIATRGDQAMMVWNAEIGAIVSQVNAQRVRPDGTLVGGPSGIGTYRVTDPAPADGGATAPRLGFPARIVPSATGFAIAVRGTLVRCGSSQCPSVRVAEIDPHDVINGRGGVQGDDPSPNVVLVGSQDVPWTLGVTFGGSHGPAQIETFGSGPVSHLGLAAGELAAAWIHDGAAHAIVKTGDAFRIVDGVASGDASAPVVVQRTAFECNAGIPAVRLGGPSTNVLVRADDPGATDVMVWAMNTPPTAASPRNTRGPRAPVAANVPAMAGEPVSDVVAIRAGLLVARATRIELQRCAGDVLAPPTTVPWETPTTDATAQ